jgi:hypothetical protein
MTFLTTQPLWLSGLILVALPTLLAMTGTILVRRRVGLDRLSANNEVAGFKFAVVGVLYAVLLAFAVIVVWEKFSSAESIVAQEAGAAATIYRLSDGIGTGPGTAVRDGLTGYIRAVITEDWAAMERGGASPVVTRALDGIYAAVLTFSPGVDQRGGALLSALLQQLDTLTQARRARLVLASGIVPGIVWLVLLAGAVLTVGYTLFFGAENLRAQALMTGALSALVFSGLLVIVAIDHPFAGSVRVLPEALAAVLDDFGATAAAPAAHSP